MKRLELKFDNYDGKVVTYTIDNPKEPVDPAAVNAAMDEIITQNAFTSGGGDLIAKKVLALLNRQLKM